MSFAACNSVYVPASSGRFAVPALASMLGSRTISSDLGALLQEILSFHGPAVQMGLNLRSFDDPALLVPDGANDGHGFRAQLPHDDLIAAASPARAIAPTARSRSLPQSVRSPSGVSIFTK